jgi:hypothetical protein
MRAENPPITDASLSGYLVRMFNSVIDLVESSRNVVVRAPVNNPQRGKLYFVEAIVLPQFPEVGVYYFDGTNFKKLKEA